MPATVNNTQCPDQAMLAAFVSGTLPETGAEHVSTHLDHCETCQRLTDQIGGRADSLVAALRHPSGRESTGENRALGKWMLRAKQRDRLAADDFTSSLEVSVSVDQFVACLVKSRLLSEADARDLPRADDATTLARQLVQQEALTPFQARALLRGRWKGLVLGQYEVLQRIGRGGMGQVFRGRHRATGQEVCLKVLNDLGRRSPQHLERFRREAETIAALNHPNIVVAYDASEEAGLQYIAMEYVRGSDLAKFVEREGALSPGAAGTLILQTARALSHAHKQGVIHRDVKPHNLMLDTNGNVKILDMGLARFEAEQDDDHQTQMTKTGAVLGTVDYMAPEQALNARNADARCDVYSLGCTMHFLLTGRSMFRGETVVERLIAHRESLVPSLRALNPQIPASLDAIFQQAVAKNPDHRFQSMDDFARSLEGSLAAIISGKDPAQRPAVQEEPVLLEAVPNAPIPLQAVPWDGSGLTPGQIPPAVPHQHAGGGPSTASTAHDPLAVTMSDPPSNTDTLHWLDSASSGASLGEWPSNQRPVARSRARSRNRQRRKPISRALIWGGTATAVSVVGLTLVALLVSALAPDSNRALVVISPHGFSDADYQAVTQALDRRAITHLTASTQDDYAKSSKGHKISVDVNLANAKAGDYDAVIVCGGNAHQLKGNPFFAASLDKGNVVAGVGDGWKSLYGVWDGKKKWDDIKAGCEVQNAKNGQLVKVCDAASADSALDHIFTQLVNE